MGGEDQPREPKVERMEGATAKVKFNHMSLPVFIDRCINNRKRHSVVLGWVHEASGKCGGVGAAAAKGGAACARRPFAVDGGTDGGRGGECGVAVAGDLASQGRARA